MSVRRVVLGALLAVAAALLPVAASAHDGPPYPILVDQAAGPVLLSVWADPDVGIGTFHVYLEPLGDEPVAEGSTVRVLVQPSSGRLPERGYDAEPLRVKPDRQHFFAEVEFDAQEEWQTRFEIVSAGRRGEAGVAVEVTPPGSGPVLDFVLYLFPFAVVGFLVVRALIVSRRSRAPARSA